MFSVEKVDGGNVQRVVDSLKLDVVRHVFAFYDILYEPEHTTMYAAFENDSLRGYIVIYTALEFPSAVLQCDRDVVGQLIKYAPKNCFIMHAPPNLLSTVKRRYPNGKCYIENWMLVRKGEADFFGSELVRRLHGEQDASKLAILLSTRNDRTTAPVKKYIDQINEQPTYGFFVDEELVSYAGSFIQLPQVWMISGVYTHPKHRNRGYATLVTSAVTEEGLKNAESAALFVRSDNYPAIRIYEKIGYKKIGEKLWIDVEIGIKP